MYACGLEDLSWNVVWKWFPWDKGNKFYSPTGWFHFLSLLCVTGLSFGCTKLTVLFALLCVGQQEDVSSAPLLCLHVTRTLVSPAKMV